MMTTDWVAPPADITGQDLLGVRAVGENLCTELVPCVTNVTERIRLYSFYPWFAWKFAQECPSGSYERFVKLFRRADCLMTMIGARHEEGGGESAAEQHGEGLPGRRKLRPAVVSVAEGKVRLSHFADPLAPGERKYFAAELGGLQQYYIGTLQNLRVMGKQRTQSVAVTPGRGLRLAMLFDAAVPGDLFWKTVGDDVVTTERLDELAAFCPCHLLDAVEEQEGLTDLLLNRDGNKSAPDMVDAVRMVLHFLAARPKDDPPDDRQGLAWHFRVAAYTGVVYGSPWQDPTREKWAAYHRHELLGIAVQSLFWTVFDRMATAHDRGALPPLQSSTDVAKWFASGLGHPTLDLEQPLDVYLSAVATSLPALDNQDVDEHELRVAQLLVDEEEAEAVVRGSLQLVASLIARLNDVPAYADFQRDDAYFRDYPINLWALRALSKGKWSSFSVGEWLRWLVAHWCVGQQLQVALRKLHAQGLDTFRLRPTDHGLMPVKNIQVSYTDPRIAQTMRALRDLGHIDADYRLTPSGLNLWEELGA